MYHSPSGTKSADRDDWKRICQETNLKNLRKRLDKVVSGKYNGAEWNQLSQRGMTMARKVAVDSGTFFKALQNGAKLGKTSQEVADELGMAVASVITRASMVRKELRDRGVSDAIVDKLHLKGIRGGKETVKGMFDELAAELKALDTVEDADSAE